MSPWNAYLEEILFSFRRQQELAEKAFCQVADAIRAADALGRDWKKSHSQEE